MPDLSNRICVSEDCNNRQSNLTIFQRRTSEWKIARKDHSGCSIAQCRLLRRTVLDMVTLRCIRALGAIDLHLEDLSVTFRQGVAGEFLEPGFIQR